MSAKYAMGALEAWAIFRFKNEIVVSISMHLDFGY